MGGKISLNRESDIFVIVSFQWLKFAQSLHPLHFICSILFYLFIFVYLFAFFLEFER